MTPLQPPSFDDLFAQALDVAPSELGAWLDSRCGQRPEWREKLERLLRADAAAHGFLEAPAALFSLPERPLAEDRATPVAFGVWQVVGVLGQGGMGSVYLAERVDGEFEQRAAIKLLTYPTPGLIQRFRQERQILARLDHPNIARLIDGGVDDSGAPYFVMEYIDGVPVTQYVNDRGLHVSARLRLFLRVCSAVQFAHQNLVVHRDLKPSNILVTADGVPKLLDFGIAKVLATTDEGAATQTAARLLTPDYAAPEQFHGDAITTATDVYALGIILFELLTGTRPPRPDVTAPSTGTKFSDVAPLAPSAAIDTKATDAASLRRVLRGDLDRIILKAIAHEPKRRYVSAEAFAADIERYLSGRPIAARPDTAAYILRKFIKRNRIFVAAAIVVLASVLIGTAVALWEARRADLQAQQALAEARTADAVKNFLVDVFRAASPNESLGRKATALDLLASGSRRIATELQGQPRVQTELFATLAKIYLQLGQMDAVRETTRQGLDRARDHFDSTDPLVLQLELYAASAADEQSPEKIKEAMTWLDHVIATEHALPPDRQNLLVPALIHRAELERNLGHLAVSEDLLRNATSIARNRGAAGKPDLLLVLTDLAVTLTQAERFPEAQQIYRDALANAEQSTNPKAPEVLRLRSLLADNLQQTGKHAEAQAILRDLLRIEHEVLGDDHPNRAMALMSLAQSLTSTGDLAEAEKFCTESIAVQEKVYGAESLDVAIGLGTLANIKYAQSDYAAAGELERRALSIFEKNRGPTHVDVMRVRHNLAVFEYQAGDFDHARRDFEAVLQSRRTVNADAAPELVFLGNIARLQGHPEQAKRIHRDALADAEKHESTIGTMTWYSHLALARDERDLGEREAARADAQFVADTVTRAKSATATEVRVARFLTAQIDYLDGQCERALPILQQMEPLGDSMRGYWRGAEVDLLLGLCKRKSLSHDDGDTDTLISRSIAEFSKMPVVDPFFAGLIAHDAHLRPMKKNRS